MPNSTNASDAADAATRATFVKGIAAAQVHIDAMIKELEANPAGREGAMHDILGEANTLSRLFTSYREIGSTRARIDTLSKANRLAKANNDAHRVRETGQEIPSTFHILWHNHMDALCYANQIAKHHAKVSSIAVKYGSDENCPRKHGIKEEWNRGEDDE